MCVVILVYSSRLPAQFWPYIIFTIEAFQRELLARQNPCFLLHRGVLWNRVVYKPSVHLLESHPETLGKLEFPELNLSGTESQGISTRESGDSPSRDPLFQPHTNSPFQQCLSNNSGAPGRT